MSTICRSKPSSTFTTTTTDKCADASTRCEDYNACTVDFCVNGLCYNVPNVTFCDDGNSCTKNDRCTKNRCSGTMTDCDDENPCTQDSCVQDQKTCTYVRYPDGSPCFARDFSQDFDSGSTPCGFEGICLDGSCSLDYSMCEDDDPCTSDSCEDGACVNVYVSPGTPCDDYVPCTVNDSCVPIEDDGSVIACMGTFSTCDDGNSCTDDYCLESTGVCVNDANVFNGKICTARAMDKCRTGGTCTGGTCVGSAVNCSAVMTNFTYSTCNSTVIPNPSQWICDPKEGCGLSEDFYSSVATISACDDGNPCTEDDVCDSTSGTCTGIPVVCDLNALDATIASCVASFGCVDGACVVTLKPEGTPCDDGDPCTRSDTCRTEDDGSNCVGIAIDCGSDENNPCVTAECVNLGNGTSVCVVATLLDGSLCDDGNPCTDDDSCTDSVCSGYPMRCDDFNDCTEDYCKNGTCSHYDRSASTECSSRDFCFPTGTCDGNGTCVGVPLICPPGTNCAQGHCL